jgi:hypothetical protein
MLVAKSNKLDMNELLKYEMCACPPSIFDSPELLRKPDKANLAKAIIKYVTKNEKDKYKKYTPIRT